MAIPVFNVEAAEAGTVTVTVQVQDSDGTAANLTGYTGSIQVRATTLSDEVLATGTVTIDADDGIVTAVIPASQTTDWTVGVYDIRIVNGTTVEYVCRGTITLTPTVTQP